MLHFNIVNYKLSNITETGVWPLKKSKKKNEEKFIKNNGKRMELLPNLIENDQQELAKIVSEITQTTRDQMYPKILKNITQQKLSKNQEFLQSTIESSLYTLTCTHCSESLSAQISFTPLTSESEISLIKSRVSSKFGPSEPKTK